jgi:hypothetical protein
VVGVAEQRLYQLEPLDTSGVFLGLGVVQAGLLGGGILLAVAGISAGVPVLVAALPLAGAVVLCFTRVGGHAAWEWLPLGASWLWSGLTRGRRWAPPLPLWPVDAERPPPLPPCLAGLDVVEVPWNAGALAAVHDARGHALTAVLPMQGAQFLLENHAEQERLVAAWGAVLSQFAAEGGTVAHIAWSDLVRPSGLAAPTATLAERPGGTPHLAAQASYLALLDQRAPTATTHEVSVSITVTAERLRCRPGNRGERLGEALGVAVDALLRSLASAGIDATAPLDALGLWRTLRLHVDPTMAGPGRARGRLGQRLGLVTPASAGPLMLESDWRAIRLDATWQRTWWVGSWPRLAVPPAWLEPFLSPTGVTRTMTVAMVPVSTYRSRRRIERDLVKLESDAAIKEEKGRRIGARHQRATQALLERERELVAGFAEMAYVGLVTVAATSVDELDQHAEIVEQLAHEAGMELRVLDGRQDLAWAGALPLGLAPTSVLAP